MWKVVKAQMDQQNQTHEELENNEEPFDFTHVNSIARIALYDDLLSAPHVTEIQPAPTAEFIENLATSVYQQSKAAGGTIPYTVIREVSENFIHARFQEATVSILDNGCTIRFADQGPGIACKDRAQLPGFTSAIEPMKSYIRGVGSGLPIVKEYLDFTHGTITIEDNLGSGSVVTISANGSRPELPEELKLESEAPEAAPAPRYHIASGDEAPEPIAAPRYNVAPEPYAPANQIPQPAYAQQAPMQAPAYPAQGVAQPQQPYPATQGYAPQQPYGGAAPGYGNAYQQAAPYPYAQNAQQAQPATFNAGPSLAALNQREQDFLNVFLHEGALRVTDLVALTGVAQSSVYNVLTKLEGEGILEKTRDKRRQLTAVGRQMAQQL